MGINVAINDTVFERLRTIVGSEHVLTDDASCVLYSQDVFTKDTPALAVVLPENTQQLADSVRTATESGYEVIPRGGGMSYTSGYVPVTKTSLIVDLGRMNKIIEINRQDMYVTLECGCTWKELYDALKDTGLRTPYWGTLSGKKATIGGGLSQNSIFWGSGEFGSAADSVIGLEVVLADGSIVKTGSAAQLNGTPFFRHFGPDLTGLFTCDAGTLGFKATATFRLIPVLPAKQFAAFDFKTASSIIGAMSEIARNGIAMECFGFDPFLQQQRMKRESLGADVKALAAVMKTSDSLLSAVKDGAKIALAGRGYMDDVNYSLQVMIEDRNTDAANARLMELREICARYDANEIENSIPKLVRANPFGPLNSMLGPNGERWVPIHALLPHSKIDKAHQEMEQIIVSNSALIERYSIGIGCLFATVSTHSFVLEPVFFWPDEITEVHRHAVEGDHLARLKGFPKNLNARTAVEKLRAEMLAMFAEMGAIHMQIGKAYNYRNGIRSENWKLIKAIKGEVDPTGKINPQSLGFD